jgi:hypothetical protein
MLPEEEVVQAHSRKKRTNTNGGQDIEHYVKERIICLRNEPEQHEDQD